MLTDDTHAVMTKAEFNDLLRYDISLPTGTIIGKRWKRHCFGKWTMGEYVEHPDPEVIGVKWREILLVNP